MHRIRQWRTWLVLLDPRIQLGALVGGLLLASLGGYDLATPGAPRLQGDLVVLGLSALLLTWATMSSPGAAHDYCPFPPTVRPTPLRWGALAIIAVGVGAGAWAAQLLWSNPAQWWTAVPFWLGGMFGVLLGAVVLDQEFGRWTRSQWDRSSAAALIGILTVLSVAAFFRTYRLDEVPPGIFIDETNGAMDAVAILRGAPVSPFGTGWYETPSGNAYFHAAFIYLLGPTFVALKAPWILISILGVLGTYLLGRALFGTPAGLVASAIMAFSMWPVNMARWGWNANVPPVAHVWAAYFLVRGARGGRATAFALAGLISGLGMYSYLGIRLVMLAIAVYLVYRAIVDRQLLREHVGGLVLFAVLWGLTFAPLAVTYARNPAVFVGRANEITIQRDIERAGGSLDPLYENVRRHLLMFNVEGDRNGRHNVPGRPMLDPIVGALLVIAAVRAVLLIRDQRWGLLVLWIPVILLGGVLSALSEGPQAYRTQSTMVAIALLAGELLAQVGARLAQILASFGWPRAAAIGVPVVGVVGLLAWSAALNYRSYFVDFAAHPTVYIAFTPLEAQVAREVATAPDPSALYLAPNLFYFSTVRYFASGLAGRSEAPPYKQFQGPDDLPLSEPGQRDAVLIWGSDWLGLTSLLRPLYPNLLIEQVPNRAGGLLYEKVTIPQADLREIRGLLAEARGPDGRTERLRLEDPGQGLAELYDQVTWSGSLYVPRSGQRAVWVADGAAVLVDGKPGVPPTFLPEGLHRLQVNQSGAQARAGLRLLWGEQAGGVGAPIPAENLFVRAPTTDRGLLGTYYRGEAWDGPPLFQRVDAVILFGWPEPEPVPGPFSVRWQGEIEIATSGPHAFIVNADDGARLWLDGRVVGESMRPNTANFFEIRVDLTRGRHPIRLEYFQRGGAKSVQLRWIRPGLPGGGIVPSEVLWPAAPQGAGGDAAGAAR